MPLERVVVFGYAGSGKSTLARQLADKLGLTYFEMDQLHWNPGWQGTPTPELRAKVEAATKGSRWATEGSYGQVRDVYLSKADTVIWLDYPFWLVFLRLLKRTIGRIMFKQAVCNGNYETLQNAFFSPESLLLYVLKSRYNHWKKGELLSSRWSSYSHLEVMRFRSPRQTRCWLEGL